MQIICNTKIDKLILNYNQRIFSKEGNRNFTAFMRRVIVSLLLNKETEISYNTKKLSSDIEKIMYFEHFEKWLKLQQLYTVPFDRITCLLISHKILKPSGEEFSGYALQYDKIFYILVFSEEDFETSISILTHEIIHIELEAILKRFEKRNIIISESLKEELVILLEHTFLLDELKIEARDLCIKQILPFRELMHYGTEEAVLRWLRSTPENYREKEEER